MTSETFEKNWLLLITLKVSGQKYSKPHHSKLCYVYHRLIPISSANPGSLMFLEVGPAAPISIKENERLVRTHEQVA